MSTIEPDIAHLDFPTKALPCELPTHPGGEEGCDPALPASWVIDAHHPGSDKGVRIMICAGHMIWLRGRIHSTIQCRSCQNVYTLAEYFTVIGPC